MTQSGSKESRPETCCLRRLTVREEKEGDEGKDVYITQQGVSAFTPCPTPARDPAPTPTLQPRVRGGEVRTSSLTQSTSFAGACFILYRECSFRPGWSGRTAGRKPARAGGLSLEYHEYSGEANQA